MPTSAACACKAAGYITGQNLTVDGGISDHMLAMITGRPGKPPVGRA